MNAEEWGVDVAVFKQGYRTAYKNESVTVYAVDRNEAAEKARNEVGRGDEWVKVIRVWKKRGRTKEPAKGFEDERRALRTKQLEDERRTCA